MIPKKVLKAALAKKANVGRHYTLGGTHSHYSLRLPQGGTVIRQSSGGILAAIRHFVK